MTTTRRSAPTFGALILRSLLSLLLFNACILLSGCGEIPRERLVKIAGYGQQLSAQLEANLSVPESLFIQGVITRERRDFINTHVANARRLIKSFNNGMTAALATERPDVRSLVSVAADLVAEVQSIARDASPEWKKALAVIEVSLRAIASYFATQAASVRKSLGRGADALLARHLDMRALRVVEDYAAGR
jgi:hypothetical protein